MATASIEIEARGTTDVGKRRERNEDSFLVDEELGLFIVADGMGGHAGGGIASRLAVETMRSAVRRAVEANPEPFRDGAGEAGESPVLDILRAAVEESCAVIYRTAQGDPGLTGMGTTVTAVLVAGSMAYVAHVGDSRCYLVRAGHIYQVSEDHSLVNEQLKAGMITPEEARWSRLRNVITRSVGFERNVKVDLMGLELQPGDHVVLCCDGLSNQVDDHEILAVVDSTSLDSAPGRLIDLANSRGGDDNITAIVVAVRGH